jgi:glycoside/pentoside/hexuronide:cation symporter, GPH family
VSGTPPDSQPLSSRHIAAYASGNGPVAILGLPLTVFLPPYIAAGGQIDVGLVGLLFSICALWDGLVDPMLGQAIDRMPAGPAPHRRWMMRASLPLAVLVALLVGIGDTLSFWMLLPLLLLFYSMYSLFDVAHLAWGSALTANASESGRLFGAREWASKIVLVAAFGAPALAQLLVPAIDMQGRIIAYTSLVAIALPVALIALARLPDWPVPPEPGIGWRRELSASLSSRPLLLLLAVQLINAFAVGALTALFIFYADGALRLDHQGSILLFLTFVGGALVTPLWTQAAARFNKALVMVAMAVWMIGCMLAGLLITPGIFWQAALFSTALGGGFVAVVFTYGMASDYVPHDQAVCGRDRSGFIFALVNLMQKGGVAIAIAVAYALLDRGGFVASDPGRTPDLLRTLFAALPVAGWLVIIPVLLLLAREAAMQREAIPRS